MSNPLTRLLALWPRRRDPHDRLLTARVLGRIERLEALADEILRQLAEARYG
ncbi:MAG: hypothetical protein JXM75_10925 [Chromatiaceae bacterium]|nr:hypothetical protein [Chromatiaceae bacterium]